MRFDSRPCSTLLRASLFPLTTPSEPRLYPCIGAIRGTLLFWCKGGDGFFETRIATQRVPVRVKFEKAVA